MNKILTPDRQDYDRGEYTTFEQGAPPGVPQLSLADLLMVLKRRKWWLIGTVAIITLLGIVAATTMTPLYSATTSVMVDPREERVVNVEDILTGLPADAGTLESEIEVLKSDALAKRVIAQTGLDATAEFNPLIARAQAEANPPLIDVDRWISAVNPIPAIKRWVAGAEEEPVDPDASARRAETAMLGKFMSRVDVRTVGRSRVLEVTFTSEDPALAQRVADTIAQLYITQQLEAKFDARQRANQWLGERLSKLREEVEKADRAVEQYRAQAGIVEGRDTRLINEQISGLNAQLIIARSDLNAARAQLSAAESAVRQRGGRAAFDAVDSPIVTNLRNQETLLRQREAELLNTLGPRHPQVIDLKEQIREIQNAIGAEAGNRLNGLRSQVQVAQERVSSLEANARRLEQEAGRLGGVEVEYRQLERVAEANRTLYQNFLSRSRETEEVNFERPNAYIVSNASMPLDASFPNKKLVVAAAFVIACFLGLVLVFVAEQMETGLQTQDDVERLLRERTLSLIPVIPGALGRRRPQDYVLEKPSSAFAQAVKSLFTSLVIAHQRQGGGNVILVTSAVPGEGKSTTAASLARIMSVAGRKALLIDCDLRRPQVHEALKLDNKLGLADFLAGGATLPQVLKKDPKSGADVITAGSHVDHPEEILRNPLFEQLLVNMGPQYSLIVLDTPPVTPVSDTLVLADKASQCVMVARWRRTPAKLVEKALRRLKEAGGNVVGIALTQVDTRKAARYGSGEADYYIGKRGSYFKN
ncbi:GumC family protein [Arenibaculum pallidiluteum]|uniref:GumC family protein n=1 Tax=Arenibaculum pallidiluteum TaxID=2812559 RepID=UPI001A9565C7|nr:polysaccharide biosynthesis tyrosine autokinase [Arenibaculum pallidiluteum]